MEIKNKPLVTVYIPNHNYGKYIAEAIESVINQTYPNIEIIIIDDASKDDSMDIITNYEQHYKLKKVILNTQKQGLIYCNNKALKNSKGKYFIRLDADDYLINTAIEILVEQLEIKTYISLVYSGYILIDEDGRQLDINLNGSKLMGACSMIRTRILKKINGYDTDINCRDGFNLLLKLTQNKYKILNLKNALFYYRKHNNSLSSNKSKIIETMSYINSKYKGLDFF